MKRILTLLLFISMGVTSALAVGTAQVQFINASQDTALRNVTILVVGTTSDTLHVAYNASTSFKVLSTLTPLEVFILKGTSVNLIDTVQHLSLPVGTLLSDSIYIAALKGYINPAAHAANPDAISTALGLAILPHAHINGLASGSASFAVFHGVPDGPAINVKVRGVGTVIRNLSYGDFASEGYLTVPASNYIIDVVSAADTTILLKTFYADLSTAAVIPGGAAAVVFASGLADTSHGQPEFNLLGAIAALSPGNGIPFRIVKTTGVQFIHNAADPALDSLKLFLVSVPDHALLNSGTVYFHTASPFFSIPSQIPFQVVIAPGNATSISQGLKTAQLGGLATDAKTVVTFDGVAVEANFAANPDGNSTLVNGYVKAVTATTADSTRILVHNGTTDAPSLTFVTEGTNGVTLGSLLTFGQYSNTATLAAGSMYRIDVTDGSSTIGTYELDLATQSDSGLVLYTSGFVNDTLGQTPFSVWASKADGTTYQLQSVVGIDTKVIATDIKLFPNPATTSVRLSYSLESATHIMYNVVNSIGQTVEAVDLGTVANGSNSLNINVAKFAKGMYLLHLTTDNHSVVTRPFIVE